MTGYAAALIFAVFAGIFFLAALFTWIAIDYGLDLAFLAVAAILLVIAIAFAISAQISKQKALREAEQQREQIQGLLAAKADPLAEHIPEELLTHPVSQKILGQIEESPIAASATALGLGVLLSHQLLDAVD